MDLLIYPNPALRETALPVGAVTPEVVEIARQMEDLMRARRGVGLAGPQVSFNRRLIVVNTTGQTGEDRVFVDPRISARRGSEDIEEGCLSFPEIRAHVRRPSWIRVEATSLDGTPISIEADGFLARVIQHEIDHLDGVLLVDRMSPAERRANRTLLRELEDRFAQVASP